MYRAIPAVSQSTLKQFSECPQKWKLAPKKEPTAAMKWGSLVDSMWLTGDLSRYAMQPSVYIKKGMRCPICRTVTDSKKCAKCKVDRVEEDVETEWNNNSATCSEWVAEQQAIGKEVIPRDAWVKAQSACDRLNGVPEIKLKRSRCDTQVAVVSMMDGILVKGLIDMVPKKEFRMGLGDLKTAGSADPKGWPRYVFDMKLHWQAALYLDLWNKESGENLEWFYHFVVEQEAPHEPCFMPLSQDFIALGRRDYQRALRLWGECEEKGEFPGYALGAVVECEDWMKKDKS